MPNQLSIPFKKTYSVPLKQAVYNHIQARHPGTHPDAFRYDISRWELLRKEVISSVVHIDRTRSFITYHAQLVFILTKLPADIGLEIPYAPVFAPSALPVTLNNLNYERCAILFNLAALYSQVATAEDRSNPEGVKRASAYFQSAAGVLSYLAASALVKLPPTPGDEGELLEDLSEPFIKSLEWLMLAQAQECAWQRAVLDNRSNGIIARLAAQVSAYYGSSISAVSDASLSIRHIFPSDWLPHLETKQMHFEAAAQYRKSVDELEANRYGEEIARLSVAQVTAKRGHDVARRGGVTRTVLQDIKSLLDILEGNLIRANRDNDLIYHKDVPAGPALSAILRTSVVQSNVPPQLQDPKSAIGSSPMIFGELLGWGAETAIDIYNDRRQNYIKDDIVNRAQELDDQAHATLRSLSLPTALDALEKPIRLPPSLLQKAEEVRLENGPQRIEKSIDDVQMLAQRDMNILNEAMDILDQEASEDESFRNETPTPRLPSHEANADLIEKEQRYRNILEQAADSDAVIRQRWDEWERPITELTWDEATLEASVPSSTVNVATSNRAGNTSTQTHARGLRALLEQLDDLCRARSQLVTRAQRLADADDIQPRVLKAAAAVERWVEVQPSMFEDVLDEELSKFDKFRNDIEAGAVKQEEVLESIKTRNESFLLSRRDDPSVREREHALQSLDLAYHKYKEITRHLDEGLQFYNDFGDILMKFKENCKNWVDMRRDEMHSISRPMESLSIQPEEKVPASAPVLPSPPVSPTSPLTRSGARGVPKARQLALDLPPPHSDAWQTFELPPPPAKERKTRHAEKMS